VIGMAMDFRYARLAAAVLRARGAIQESKLSREEGVCIVASALVLRQFRQRRLLMLLCVGLLLVAASAVVLAKRPLAVGRPPRCLAK